MDFNQPALPSSQTDEATTSPVPVSNRRSFFKYIGTAAATTALISGAQLLSPPNHVAAAALYPFDGRPADEDDDNDDKEHGKDWYKKGKDWYRKNAKPNGINVLLVHGAFAGAASWAAVIAMLQRSGYNAVAVENPLTSLADDVEVTREALAYLKGPTVLVGHSYGGAVITNAATNAPNAVSLVYAAALAPLEGESVNDILGRYPPTEGSKFFVPSYRKNFIWLDPQAFPRLFVQDIPPIAGYVLASIQKPIAPECFSAPSGSPAWKNLPSWYLVSQNDLIIQPDTERMLAKRIGATTSELPASHASPVSHPHDLFQTILLASRVALKS